MNALLITIPVSLLLAAVFVIAFIIAARRDQFEDLTTPAHRMLLDDEDIVDSTDSHARKDHNG